ncbi:MAG: hypothetical protein WB586_06645, partial [Chthoniobacterales bacterium]
MNAGLPLADSTLRSHTRGQAAQSVSAWPQKKVKARLAKSDVDTANFGSPIIGYPGPPGLLFAAKLELATPKSSWRILAFKVV